MRDIQQKIRRWLKENERSGIDFLSALVREPSAQGNEASAQQLVARKLQEIGLEVDIWEPSGEALINHKYFHSPRTNFKGSPNVVGALPGTGGGRSIILNGHIDVVPEGERNQWKEDPYSGKVADGKLFGRGSSDMKGGNVSLLLAIEAIKACGVKLKGDVIFQSVVEEESGGAGTLSAALRGYKADAALIPEPTRMRVFPKQQGSMWFRIHVEGRLAHGGTRYEGVSAIEKSMLVIEEIRRLETERNARITDPLYERTPIPIPINVGVIEGGNWPSSVPDKVKIEGRMGVAPDETMEHAQQELQRCVDRMKEADAWFKEHPPVLEWFGGRWVPGSIDLEHELMNILVEQYRSSLGADPEIEASPWGTDGGLLNKVANTPTIVFGPGETDVAHQANEYVELENVMKCAEIVAFTILKWCGVARVEA